MANIALKPPPPWSWSKMTILTILSSNGHCQMVKITDISTILTTKIGNFKDCHDQIWIDHFDHGVFFCHPRYFCHRDE
jgi:hypothetical protein